MNVRSRAAGPPRTLKPAASKPRTRRRPQRARATTDRVDETADDGAITTGDAFRTLDSGAVTETSLRFAYAWVALGYVVPGAVASALDIDVSDASRIDAHALTTLAVILLACEGTKAALTVRALERVGANAEFRLDAAVAARGAAFGVLAAVLARAVDYAYDALILHDDAGASGGGVASFMASGDLAVVATTVAASCAVAPFLEELFFRHFLLRTIETKTHSRAVASVASSAIFACAHFSVHDFPSLFACGVVFAAAAASSPLFGVSVVAHGVYNASVLIESSFIHSHSG